MKKILLVACIFALSLFGCRSMSTMTRNITGSDDALVAQLPEEQLASVEEARFHLNVANEDVTLADLRQRLADYHADIATLELALAKNTQERMDIELDIAQEKALSEAGLREPGESVKTLASYNEEHISNESKRYDIEAKIKKVQLRIEDLTSRIHTQEQRVSSMSYSSPVSAPISSETVSEAASQDSKQTSSPTATSTKKDIQLPDYLKVEDDPETTNGAGEDYSVEEGNLSK
mgnify:CR=1 FL=1